MADSYVCSGATMKCTMGTSQARLTVLPTRTVFLTGQPMANISDHLSMVNLAPFGRCRSMGFPATASATAANHGTLTPMPCMHNTPFPWMGGKNDYIIKGDPALLKSSTCQCLWGGTISLVTDGQTGTGAADLRRRTTENFERDQVSTEGLTAENVLDGIQMALDVAGMVPLAGAIPDLTNAAISALRGNWAEAGLSVLAAVPLVGDAAGGAKIVKNGVKIAKAVEKKKNVFKFSEKISSQASKLAPKAERKIVELEPGSKGNWNKQLNKKPEPSTNYLVGDKLYKTDEKGRVRNVSGKLELGKIGRNTYQQRKSVDIKDGIKGVDDGGHLIAHQFKGAGEQINYVPMLGKDINRGQWKNMEQKWYNALNEKPPKDVEVNINALYKPSSERPLGFVVEYKIDGVPYREVFKNYTIKK